MDDFVRNSRTVTMYESEIEQDRYVRKRKRAKPT